MCGQLPAELDLVYFVLAISRSEVFGVVLEWVAAATLAANEVDEASGGLAGIHKLDCILTGVGLALIALREAGAGGDAQPRGVLVENHACGGEALDGLFGFGLVESVDDDAVPRGDRGLLAGGSDEIGKVCGDDTEANSTDEGDTVFPVDPPDGSIVARGDVRRSGEGNLAVENADEVVALLGAFLDAPEIGRASCRERV